MLDKSQWIGVQKKWASVSSWLKKLAAEYFLIPQELEADLIPLPYLCIAELLAFPFPLQNAASIALQPAQFFSPIAPDIGDSEMMLRVRRLPIPDSKTIHKLIASSHQSWLDGAQSVIYSHVGESPWTKSKKVWGRLRAYQAWVDRQRRISAVNPTRAALAEDTAFALTMLPWGLAKRGCLQFGTISYALAVMNDMLELLRHKINTNPNLVKNTRTRGTALVPKILEAYHAADAGTYWIDHGLRWIRDAADDIVQNNAALITSAHLGPVTDEPHWAAVVFNCRDTLPVVHYGDALKAPIPEELSAACSWWLGKHTPTEAEVADLPIACQTDGHSCGILVDNAQAHFVDPTVPLDVPTHVANSRLEMFNRIATRGLEQACHPNAPTPNPSPEKRRIFKRRSEDTLLPPPQPVFVSSVSPFERRTAGDVFGPMSHAAKHDSYGTEYEYESDGEGRGGAEDEDEYTWSAEDDAPLPPESQMMSQTLIDDAAVGSEDEALYRDLPALQDISDSKADDSDEDGEDSADESCPDLKDVDSSHAHNVLAPASSAPLLPPPVQPAKSAAAGKSTKITAFWKVETTEEKANGRRRSA
ncbi:hypothetical protein B0H14DRAFT_3786413 [Mycena olivaceomarginata]|nr:hypothetical protein B0H14DRAFT_3786413 [Mycena olivaceomarginata]